MKYFVNIILILISYTVFGQQNSFQIISFDASENELVVQIDISTNDISSKFNCKLEIKNIAGQTLCKEYIAVSNDSQISNGQNKITCNLRKEGIVIDDSIYINLAFSEYIPFKQSTILTSSLLYPGYGSFKQNSHKINVLIGTIGYASIATGSVFNIMAYNTYNNDYLNANINEERNLYFDKSKNQQKLSYTFFSAALGIWLVDIIRTQISSKQIKNAAPIINDVYYYSPSDKIIQISSPPKYINTKNHFERTSDIALQAYKNKKLYEAKEAYSELHKLKPNDASFIEILQIIDDEISILENNTKKVNQLVAQGDSYLSNNRFTEALDRYHEALEILPTDTSIKSKISATTNLFNQNKYDKLIDEGEIEFGKKNYLIAKEKYSEALALKIGDEHCTEMIKQIDSLLSEQENNRNYQAFLSSADSAYQLKNYSLAKSFYLNAYKIDPDKSDLSSKISDLNNLIYEEEKDKRNKEYIGFIIEADLAFELSEHEKALGFYNKASFVKPDEEYPKSRIKQIEQLKYGLSGSVGSNTDLPLLFAKCKKSIFMIIISGKSSSSQGSGFVISEDGIAISNYHVFEMYKKGNEKLLFDDDREFEIDSIIEADKEYDYIIFKIKSPKNYVFDYVKYSEQVLNIGENVFAIGNPLGLEKTLSKGIISGYRGDDNELIQTDTDVTHGSSGGPLFNMRGEVLGITSMVLKSGGANLNFAISIELLDLERFLD